MSYIIKMALDIKVRSEPPALVTSPLEAYYAIGAIVEAMKFKMSGRQDTLFQVCEKLSVDIGPDRPEDGRVRKVHTILTNFIRDGETIDQMMEYVAYGYENER